MNKTRGVSLIARTGSKINAPCSRRGATHFDAFDANLATRGVHASISDWLRTPPPASVSCFKSAALDASRDASGIVWGGSGGVSSSTDESELIGRDHRLGSRDASAASRRARSDTASGRPRARAARLRQGDSGDAGATEDGAVARSLTVRSPGDASPPVVSVASCPLVSACVASSADSSSDESSDDGPSDDGAMRRCLDLRAAEPSSCPAGLGWFEEAEMRSLASASALLAKVCVLSSMASAGESARDVDMLSPPPPPLAVDGAGVFAAWDPSRD